MGIIVEINRLLSTFCYFNRPLKKTTLSWILTFFNFCPTYLYLDFKICFCLFFIQLPRDCSGGNQHWNQIVQALHPGSTSNDNNNVRIAKGAQLFQCIAHTCRQASYTHTCTAHRSYLVSILNVFAMLLISYNVRHHIASTTTIIINNIILFVIIIFS